MLVTRPFTPCHLCGAALQHGRALGSGAADGVAEPQQPPENLYSGSSCPSVRVDLALKRAAWSL